MIIDFHTHTFPAEIAGNVIGKLQMVSRSRPYTDATRTGLRSSMEQSSIDYSVTLPVMTNPRQVEKLNTIAGQAAERIHESGIIPFGGMHPDYENYKTELHRLRDMGVPGIKLHPAYQNVDFDDIRFLRIMDTATELGLIILTHAGMDIGIPGHNFTSIKHIHHVLQEIKPEKLVLAHMGGWDGWKDVERDLAGAPVWLDTAFSLGIIEPAPGTVRTPDESMMMNSEDFLRLARKHGTDRILFATDSPWSSQPVYMDYFRNMSLTDQEREDIMGENARKLLGLSL